MMDSNDRYSSSRSPECFDGALGGVTLKSDIFSVGVVLWEIFVQARPWDGLGEFQVLSHCWSSLDELNHKSCWLSES